MCSHINELKNLFYQSNNNFGKNSKWILLNNIFKYSYDTINTELLNTLYEIYETIDVSIIQENNPEIFYKRIIFQNTSFYNQLCSHQDPSSVFNKNKQKLIDFTIMKRYIFMAIIELLNMNDIIHYIEIIKVDEVILYDENIIKVKDEEYINGDYAFMVFESEKEITHIPLKLRDDQYIKFFKNLTK